ncbi:M56 family metallopeptidase [Aquisalinus flavus]|uniref:Peptidase M56 domain-containing protein n=1 Tax=Aquisalinus flavus TaxID=1526572 RepID=A0A8J2V393_9PROT|nr:M56 family metallopeptidase [Aquisalinus flavus]MBD0426169.1 hypothetical protein [Aquisalinus flavus]UNE48254.1 hypothetical protein FF099_09420 [Aquisalinus flavus]GGD10034.1 hypothetical protein GCM10011342_18690 [Aquisalinus flavus]
MSDVILTAIALMTVWATLIWLLARLLPQKYSCWPRIWLCLIVACLTPVPLALTLPDGTIATITAGMNLPVATVFLERIDSRRTGAQWLLASLLTIYIAVAAIILARLLLAHARYWQVADRHRQPVIETTEPVPPVATPWPLRAIILPAGFDDSQRNFLLAHERRHLVRFDPEMTLVLEVICAALWINLPLRALVRRWRLSAELAVDADILAQSTPQQRKEYAELLVNQLSRIRGRAVPCPSAALTLSEERSAKMRVMNILDRAPRARKPALGLIVAASLTLSATGTALATVITGAGATADLDPKYLMPVGNLNISYPPDCITADLDYPLEEKVVVSIDIRTDGSVSDARIVRSSIPCMNPTVLDFVGQFEFLPLDNGTDDMRSDYVFAVELDLDGYPAP